MDVQVRCLCPPDGTRHEADTVTLKDTLSFHEALSIRNDAGLVRLNDPSATEGEILATLTESYVLFGVESWSLLDEKRKPLPPSKANIRAYLLTDTEAAMVVADVADGLYAEKVVLPLLMRASSSSPPTPTGGSTSARKDSPPTPLRRSSRSSTSTSPTDATETTTPLLAGVSNS